MSGALAGATSHLDRAPLSAQLRERTAAVHERIETLASFNRLIVVNLPAAGEAKPGDRARLDEARAQYREVYRRFLVASHGFESAVDAAIAGSPLRGTAEATGYAFEAEPPAARIVADLSRVFGAGAAANLPVMEALAPITTLPELAGTEYVRRGSRAGGAFIGAVVHRNLGLTREDGASFLLLHGKQTRSVIEAFRAWADGLGLEPAEQEAAIQRAIATFEAVGRWHQRLEAGFTGPG